MSDSAPSHATPPRALVQALRHALRPLVKLMLSRGVTFTYASELLKSLFVEVADRDFRIDGKEPTDSRVSLVSGVHRKEVSRLRQALESGEETVPEVVSLGAQVVAQWMGAPPYVDDAGQPLPLARFASEGAEQSFEALVARVNRDIRPRVVLDEWLRLGVVHIDEGGRVCLNVGAFVPTKGFDELSFYLGHNLHDHAAAAVHNLLGDEPPFMERSVHYDGLGAAAVGQLAEQARSLGMQALVAVNKNALALAKRSVDDDAPRRRMTFGVYFYSDAAGSPMAAPDAESSEAGRSPAVAPSPSRSSRGGKKEAG
ncbi:DUF6502 family protein [Variovorax saccharolyticus]|uniref:DUF6502 family protein n=1 Tax=Variovorax saccharolyticus TaxID=3053516 RepID=UPI002575F05D|nr:DUF6502 family protein [Variovorax sp. J31P216]MDM0029386.1 DUF6502 family protein [Variovorax sp. J31P216]